MYGLASNTSARTSILILLTPHVLSPIHHFHIAHNTPRLHCPSPLPPPPPFLFFINTEPLSSISLGTTVIPRRNRMLTIWQKISEIPTENWGVRFEVIRSFRLVRTKRNVAYHLPISRFRTHATQISTFFGLKPLRMWQFCGKLVNRWPLCFRHPNRILLSNGKQTMLTQLPFLESPQNSISYG